MATTIEDVGLSLKITVGTVIRNIIKSQIIEVSVIKTNIIKIDIGQGALNNVFISQPDVTLPVNANPNALKDAILGFLTPVQGGGNVGYATEAKQIIEIDSLATLNTNLNSLANTVNKLDIKLFQEPSIVDRSGPGTIFKGYALAGASQAGAVWAIEKIQTDTGIDVSSWANGNKNFTNIWANRESLSYS